MSNRIAPKLLAEFIGTFAFVFIGAGAAAVVGEGVGLPGIVAIAFAHGLPIMAFAFAYGSVSGGHMNPAVTVGVLAAGAMNAGEAAGYIVSQLIGGVVGALFLRTVLGGAETGLGTVRDRDGVFDVPIANHAQDGPKYFLARDRHLIADVDEYSRTYVVALS